MKVIASILFLLAGCTTAAACSCLAPDDRQKAEAVRHSPVIFRGKVVSTAAGDDRINVKFAVLTAWKGAAASEIVVNTPTDSAACGYNFQSGATYTVYADGNPPSTNLCTMLLVDEKRVREILGEGETPADQPAAESRAKSGENVWSRLWRKLASIFS